MLPNDRETMSFELTSENPEAPAAEERLTPAEEARVSAALQIAAEQEEEQKRSPEHRALDEYYDAQDLAKLRQLHKQLLEEREYRRTAAEQPRPSEKDEDFSPFRDCDRILAAGSVVHVDGIPCRLLVNAPVVCASFRDERQFVDHLISDDANFKANAPYLRKVYNRAGKPLGDNPQHPEVRSAIRIAEVEAQIAAAAAAPEKAE